MASHRVPFTSASLLHGQAKPAAHPVFFSPVGTKKTPHAVPQRVGAPAPILKEIMRCDAWTGLNWRYCKISQHQRIKRRIQEKKYKPPNGSRQFFVVSGASLLSAASWHYICWQFSLSLLQATEQLTKTPAKKKLEKHACKGWMLLI